MIRIEPLSEQTIEGVRGVMLPQAQVKFAGTAEEFLSDHCPTTHRHVILAGDNVVGFFKLDIAYRRRYDFCPDHAMGLRAFAIDAAHQGKGYGKASIRTLMPYLVANYPQFETIYLTVNCKNPGAQACYLKSGFVDTGKIYLGGSAGPQHIMRATIHA